MKNRFDAWAPPFRTWGVLYELGAIANGPIGFKVEFVTIAQAPSSFDAEITYWNGNQYNTDIVVGPGSHTFIASCACIPKIRFRGHTTAQIIKVTVTF